MSWFGWSIVSSLSEILNSNIIIWENVLVGHKWDDMCFDFGLL